MALKKPSELFENRNTQKVKNTENHSILTEEEQSLNLFENFQKFSKKLEHYQENDEKIEIILSEIDVLKEEIEKSLKQEQLDQAMMSQLFVVETAIRDIQKKVSGINHKELETVRTDVSELSRIVSEFVEDTLPKYKKLVLETEVRIHNKYEQLENTVDETVENITEFVESKYNQLKETISSINEETLSSILEEFNSLELTVDELKESEIPKYKKFIVETEKKVDNKLVQYEDKYQKLNSLIEEKVENRIEDFNQKLETVNSIVLEKINSVEGDKNNLLEKVNQKTKEIKEFIENEVNLKKQVVDLEVEVLRNEKKLKDVEKYLQENYKDIVTLREQVFEEINSIPIGNVEKNIRDIRRKVEYIESVYKNIKPEDIIKDVISESLNEPPSTKNKDPLTPLDQKFVTLDQLQEHYRLFINRIQQQLSTLGGGGETQLKYLDDIVGIATNASSYDGKFLKYDHPTKKFVFDDVNVENITGLDISEENIVYVAKDGNDNNPGTLSNPKLTIKAAAENIPIETVVRVAPGVYFEDNPITLPDNVTVMGHSLRETTVIPLNVDEDLFYVGNGNYVAEMSFRGALDGKAIFAFDPINERYIDQSPYIQNCTNFIPGSIGMRIDGKEALGPIKSMVLDSYTQYNQGGIGVSITNEGYAQLVSLFTICDDIAVYCGSGAACDLTNSNSSFGNYGLVADGVSPKKFVGIATSPSVENADTFVIDLSTPTLNVVNADYNNETGRINITVNQPHKFNVGMAVSIVGLAFTCPFESGQRLYPSGDKGYVFNVETVAPGRYLDAADLIVANTQEILDKSLAQVAVSYANTNFYFPGEEETNARSRYYDATRLIQKNKQEIVDKSLASIAVGFPSGFTFPGDTNPNQRYYDASRLITINKQEIVDKSLAAIAVGFPTGFAFPTDPVPYEQNRYYDASRLITLNKQEIVDKSLASVAIAHSDFYFPGDTQTTIRSRYYDAYRLIQRNREVIVGIAWTETSNIFPQFNYTETKCKRDIGFFIDAVSTDVFTGGNSYSRDFVLQYFNGTNPIGIAASEREPSVYAFQQTRDLMKQAITNTLVGAAYSDLTLTVDPDTLSNTDPLSCADVRSNVDNLVGIVTVSIGAGNTSSLPASPNLGYFNLSVGIGTTVSPGGVKCARDLGFLVEAVATDIFTGGNKYSRDFTLQYFDNNGNPISNGLVGETVESVTAFNSLRDYSKKAITNQLNYKEVGISSGPANYDGGGGDIPVLPSGNPNACTDVQNAIDTLVGIVTSVIGTGSTSSLPATPNLGISTTNKCARDLGFLVEAVATDIFTGGNKYSRDFTLQYFDNNGNPITNGLVGEVPQSVYAFNALRDYSKKAVTNQLNLKNLTVSAGISSLGSGSTVIIPVLPSGNPDSCTDVQYTINTLVGIVTSVVGTGTTSILSTFSENLGISTTNICARDLGFFVDAISTDVFTGGNKYSRDFTKQYFDANNNLIYLNGENIQSAYSFNSARDYAKKAVTNQLNYKELGISSGFSTYPNIGTFQLNLPSGNPNACADVQSNINNLVEFITSVIGVGTTGNIALLNSTPETLGTFTDGAKKCARDIGYIVNATVEDLRGYTNANIIDATKKYFNYDGTLNYVIGEESESIVAFNAARDYMKLALNNQLNVKDLTVLAGVSSIGGGGPIIPILTSGSPDACSDVRYTIDTNIEILTTAIDSASLSLVPTTVSLASTTFGLDVGIATQPHFYVPNTGTAKLNIVRPFDGQVAYFTELFYTVKKLNIVNGGSGYTDAPTITIDPPDTPWGIGASAVATVENGVLVAVDMVSNGRGYRTTPRVTISSGINTAVASAELVPEYYTVQKSTEIVNGICIVTFNENVPFVVGVGTEVSFFKQSRVLATGHSFEFIGAGNDIATALPFTGGVPIEENETDSRNGGLVVYSSTNQSGNFKIGDGVKINQNTGSITGNAYTKSLFSTMTPFILALGGF